LKHKCKSLFSDAKDIIPKKLNKCLAIDDLIRYMGATSFEARNLYSGSELYRKMVRENDTIWLGIAGAGIAGGMGGMVISLLESGFIDVICSTGAQVYHDLHFAFDLPVKAIHPTCDNDLLRKHGDTRIYDIGIRDKDLKLRMNIFGSSLKRSIHNFLNTLSQAGNLIII